MTTAKRVEEQIARRFAAGEVFFAGDFATDGDQPEQAGRILAQLAKNKKILRVGRGYYTRPKKSRFTGRDLLPGAEELARAFARKNGCKIMPDGATLSNKYQLSSQVPAKCVYVTDRGSGEFQLGSMKVSFRRRGTSVRRYCGSVGGEICAALKYVGRSRIDSKQVRRQLSSALSTADKMELNKWSANAPNWIRPLITELP